jgi:uncharacterized protein (TIGR03437 family)
MASETNPDSEAQTKLSINGDSAEIVSATKTHITFRCPDGSAGRQLTVSVENRFGVSNPTKIMVGDAAPGIFTLDGSGTGQGLVFLDGSSDLAALPDPAFVSQPAVAGETLSLMVTGLPNIPQGTPAHSVARVTIGQFTSEVLSLTDVPKHPGVKALKVRVPQNVPIGDSIPVQVFSQGQEAISNTVTIAIEQAD